eukprot:6141226-Prymnesium_polylepis.1
MQPPRPGTHQVFVFVFALESKLMAVGSMQPSIATVQPRLTLAAALQLSTAPYVARTCRPVARRGKPT